MKDISISQVLSGHNSVDTAYLVPDYPYGFKLRCKIRFWLDYRPKFGFRFMSQTTNPKFSGEVWNKPKASTYMPLAVMYLDEKGHTQWTSISIYDLSELDAFVEKFKDAMQDSDHHAALKELTQIRDMRIERFGRA